MNTMLTKRCLSGDICVCMAHTYTHTEDGRREIVSEKVSE